MKTIVDETSGNVAILFAITLFILAFLVGMAVDVSRAVSTRLSMQNALDAATLHAANNRNPQSAVEDAQGFFNDNSEKFAFLGAESEFQRRGTFVNGRATGELPLIFGKILGKDSLPINVDSTVNVLRRPTACIIALSTNRDRGLIVNGTANLVAPGCRVEVHTLINPVGVINRDVNIEVESLCFAGDRLLNHHSGVNNLETECEVEPDPYVGVFAAPNTTGCDYSNLTFNEPNVTLDPGVYCGFFNFGSSTNVHLSGGEEPYVLRNGGFTANGGHWTGDNVSFYFADANATLQFNPNVTGSFTPPTSGPYEGLLMSEAPGIRETQLVLNDTNGFNFEGIIYLPSREITMNGGASVQARELQMVARSFIFNDVSLDMENPSQALASSRFTEIYISE